MNNKFHFILEFFDRTNQRFTVVESFDHSKARTLLNEIEFLTTDPLALRKIGELRQFINENNGAQDFKRRFDRVIGKLGAAADTGLTGFRSKVGPG